MKTIMNRLALLLISLLAAYGVEAQTIITQWDFEGDVITPSTGAGTAALVGGTTATFAAGNGGGRGWNTSTYAAQEQENGQRGVTFSVSTTGYENITLSFDHRSSGTASRWSQVDYSLNGGVDWVTNFWNNNGGLSPHNSFYGFTVDFSSVVGANDNADFVVRIVSVFSPLAFNQNASLSYGADEAYMRSNVQATFPPVDGVGTGNYAPTGTWRFDNVTIEGFEIGAPIEGCTNLAACNYDPIASVDDGSCILEGDACDDGNALTVDDEIQADCSCAGVPFTPELHVLANADYSLNEWASSEAAGTYPNNMAFFWSNYPGGAGFDRTDEATGVYDCGYDLTSRPRINGLGLAGFSFITTGSPQRNDCVSGAADEDRYVGSAVLGLNTLGVTYARAEWVVTTIERNFRNFALRLQYRIGDSGSYIDFDETTVYDATNSVNDDFLDFSFDLPVGLLDQPEVYLRWVYYELSDVPTGARPELAVDNILITTELAPTVNGCTDLAACNYDPSATNDDGSCLIVGESCDDGSTLTIDDLVTGDCECIGTPVVIPDVIITELNYNPDDSAGFPDEEWEFLELYNNDAITVDLEGFSFDGFVYTFPAGAEIAPGEYVIVARTTLPYDGNGYQVFGPFVSGALSNGGETVALLDQYGNVVSTVTYSDSAPWPTAPDGDGPSLELIDFSFDLNDPASWKASCFVNGTPGAANSPDPCPTDPIIITELHYDPADALGFPDTDYEFVELFNPGASTIDLEGYSFSGINFVFPEGAQIAAEEYIIVAVNPASYEGNGFQVFGPYTGALNNGGESIVLIDAAAVVVDQVDYNNTAPWPVLPNGNGPSLELGDVTLDNNDPANWQASCEINGTPGAPNSVLPCPTFETTITAIQSDTDVDGNSNLVGNLVEINGVVTGVYADLFAMQDGTGAWSGIWVSGSGVSQGDDVTVIGVVSEPFGLTTIVSTSITVNSQENPLPAAEVLATADINQEQWEGVLLRATGTIVNGDLGFGEFSFDDASGIALVDDLGYLAAPLPNGEVYQVTGPNYYSFSNFKLAPRDADDVQKLGCTDDTALNFDEDAVIDNGTCVLELPDLVINEIHYNPCMAQGPDDVWEFVEIYNAGAATVDLSGVVVSGSINFVFPAGASIEAGEYLIIAYTASSYTGNGYQVFEWTSGQLGNSGGSVTLAYPGDLIIDTVTYGVSSPWPSAPNGTCPSLELIDPSLDNEEPANWQASYVSNGTPGAVNSTPPTPVSNTIFDIQSNVDANGGSLLTGEVVSIQGVVTRVYQDAGIFAMQDGPGPWSGIWVSSTAVTQGDEVVVSGTVSELFGLTIITAVTNIDVLSQGNTLPTPQSLFTSNINEEQWEGVLLEITGVVTQGDAGFGEWIINDGSGPARIDNLGIEITPVDEGVQYSVRGPNYFSFGFFKLEPRDANDIFRWGCTNDSFANYDPTAIIDDGSCSNAPGCTNPIADNYDPGAAIDDGSCIIGGCQDAGALNFNADATFDNGSCYFVLPSIVINEIHYNPCNFQGSDFNYEFIELYNAGSEAVNLGGFVISGAVQFTFPTGASIAADEYIVIAIDAFFYAGNGYQVFQWSAGNLPNGGGTVTLGDGFGNEVDTVTYNNSAPWPTLPGGNCTSLELIDPSLDNTDPANWQSSFVLYGTPGAQNSQNILGCTQPFACNYNPLAIGDDGSCDFVSCQGCTYEEATNYDASATSDDGSCEFDTATCIGDLNGDGAVNASDLGLFLTVFGTSCD